MRLLDIYCGAGGAAVGYSRAGFDDIVGVDNESQPDYPFTFVKADALEYIAEYGKDFDAIHASPPCQAYSTFSAIWKRDYPDLIGETRDLMKSTNKPYIIENVKGAPLENALMLCGTMFGLLVVRHRYFECRPPICFAPTSCNHVLKVVKHGRKPKRYKEYASVTGHFSDIEYSRIAMGIDWMKGKDLAQAIPPAYTEYIGGIVLDFIRTGGAV